MIPPAGTLLLAASLSLLDVPYISQSEALCGGAAAAMVMRYWGATGVAAEDFAPLVDRSRKGIATTALAAAVRSRGYDAIPAAGTDAMAQGELARGRPVMALIEDRPGAFHYVVIVGWHARAVVLHDPARTPYVFMDPAEFDRRWDASGRWMLVVVPGDDARPTVDAADGAAAVKASGDDAGGDCPTMIAEGVRLAQAQNLPASERVLAAAAFRCPGAASLRELAGVRLLQRRWPEVQDLAGRAVELEPADAHAWRLLATARFISGNHAAALDAWNRAGEPTLDLVSVIGLQRTSHRAVERLTGLNTGTMLTRGAVDRAARRLSELPAASATRVEYVPRAAGTAELRAHVVERTVLPRGRLTWAAMGLRAGARREVTLPVSSLGRGGERLDVSWRFWPGRPAGGAALHVPSAAGLVSIELLGESQPFTDQSIADARRVATHARLGDWIAGGFRWEGRAGLSRWEQTGAFATTGAGLRVERGRVRGGLDFDAWLGEERFALASARAGWRSAEQRRGFVLDASATFESIARAAPLDLWRAGDTGHARTALLRAHPVLDGGRLRTDRLGRHLLQTTIELQRWWRPNAAAALGGAVFVDAARTAGLRTGGARGDVDAGAGLRLALPGRLGAMRLDLAHGLRDGRNALSLAWVP